MVHQAHILILIPLLSPPCSEAAAGATPSEPPQGSPQTDHPVASVSWH